MKYTKYIAICLLTFAVACKPAKKDITPKGKPNIVFIMSDDHAAKAISAYGGLYEELAPTPNIDRLANEGMLLNNVFCTNAISGPSRATILTGKYSHVNGLYKNLKGGSFNPNQWTFPQALQANGYQTGFFGKWHLYSMPRGFDHFKYHAGYGQQGFYWNPVYNENGKRVTEKGYATNLTTNSALEWLASTEDKDKPFCLMLQYKAPHRNWEPDTKYLDYLEDKNLPYPATFNDDYETRTNAAKLAQMRMDDLNRRDLKISQPVGISGQDLSLWQAYGNEPEENVCVDDKLSAQENKKEKFQTYIKDYLACIKSVDDNVGRVLDYLDTSGLAENTIVVYTSDQGFFLGEHGWFDKRFMYEESIRMPFLVRYPSVIAPKSTNDDIITNLDIAPTLLDLAGVTIPDEVQGHSFFQNLQGNTPKDWQTSMYYHYYEFPRYHNVQPHYGIRNQRYKLIHFYYNMDAWEFYDLEKDPNEMMNAIANPKYKATIAQMKIDLAAKMVESGNQVALDKFRKITDTDYTPAPLAVAN